MNKNQLMNFFLFGLFLESRDGEADKKTYAARLLFDDGRKMYGCTNSNLKDSSTLIVNFSNSYGDEGEYDASFWSSSAELLFAGAGEYRVLADGSIDGNFSVSQITCAALDSKDQQ